MIFRLKTLVGWAVFLFVGGALHAAEPIKFEPVPDEASRVVVVANQNDPESIQLARFYADRRDIPRENIVALDLPTGEVIEWGAFVQRLHTPLQEWLIAEGWIEAIGMDLFDDIGRRKISPAGHRISYLVTCRGVPLKIRHDAEIPPDAPTGANKNLKTNQAAVDSELALINMNAPRRDGFVRNPLFGKTNLGLFGSDEVVRVMRLDGPTYPSVRRLIESALDAEKQGLIGRALVDIGGPHQQGDKWFEEAARILTAAGWRPQVDRERSAFTSSARADGVAIYLGWYQSNVAGPFATPGFSFAPGAIALHLHSYSAKTMRLQNGGGWTGPLVARGVAATVGNVYEPYLEFTHHPHMMIAALLAGATWGEAAYISLPALSWQGIGIGDPLYRPTTVPLAEQIENIDRLPPRIAAYLMARGLEQPTDDEPPTAEQITAASRAFDRFPSLSLAWEAALLKAAAGDEAGAIRQLGIVGFLRRVRPEEYGLLIQMSDRLSAWGDSKAAMKVWEVLLQQQLPEKTRIAWLPRAIEVSKQANEFRQMTAWQKELRDLKPIETGEPKQK
ncbi:MAG: hypothetical protein SynsKO_15110 [Synoicihabitans sp.]